MEPIVNMDRYQIQNQPTNDYVKEYFNPIWDGAEKIGSTPPPSKHQKSL